MINKRSLWFLTLFSLILILSVYYITMPSELLVKPDNKDDTGSVVVEESNILSALRVETDEERSGKMIELKTILTNSNATVEEKNNAYEALKIINVIKGKEEVLELKLKTQYKVNSFIKIDNDQVKVVIASDKHSADLANNIMRTIQAEFNEKMYISVKFEA